jgi:glycosyltransferase involved in cell wall biosynthesis
MTSQVKPINVAVYQPVIPEYRVSFFTELHRRPEINLEVFAAMSAHGSPDTPQSTFEFCFHPISFTSFFNNKLAWQGRLVVPLYFRQGDVLVICGNPRYLSNYPLILAAKKQGLGIVWWGQGHTPGSKKINESIKWHIMRLADIVLLYTDKEAENFRQSGFPPHRVYAANNTIDVSSIESARMDWTSDRLEEFRREKGIQGSKNLIFCGRLTQKARLEDALQAMAILLLKDPSYRLIIIGDGPERDSLQARARELNLGQKVIWLDSLYEQNMLAPWFLSAIVFMYPGSIGLSLMHAFAYSLPVITHNQAEFHNPEYAALKPGFNGMLFNQGDVVDLSRAIHFLGECPERTRNMGANAYKTIQEEYPLSEMVGRFVKAVIHASDIVKGSKEKGIQ